MRGPYPPSKSWWQNLKTCSLLPPHFPAGRTLPVVHIDRPTTGRAGPAFALGFDKCTDAIFPDRFKVLDHTHAVSVPVPLVQLLQPFAGIFSAQGRTEFPPPFFAGRYRTIYVTQPVRGTTPPTPVLRAEIRHADGAVHAAGRNQGSPEGVLHRHDRDWDSGILKSAGMHRHGVG